ncbi:Fic family protein [Acetobacter indonesiensis]|uniref:Cell division protein Fic n=1 Tax=Acetobacter indonesiensis TaxID=104101 RepID=A0A252AIT3_9PROT|nr:Fic family protein [Acetobacter indonesiensis]OUI89537.1 cell division protein Fic [Acetobacter indonesiensis]
MTRYIHQHGDWPDFRWDKDSISHELAAVRHRQGRLLGRMESLGFDFRSEAVLQTLTEDVIKSSEIEGENLDREQVRSSIARRLGMDIGALAPVDRDVEGVVEMMLDATRHYAESLTEERLFAWHAPLFPTGRNGMARILVGEWRDDRTGPMQVVSGPVGREKVHYEAPTASRVPAEMQAFLDWCNAGHALDPVLKAAIAHLWFVTIHPFEDGNGRMARAIGDLMLARSEQTDQRFYSLSAQIRHDRKDYYAILEATQKGDMDITLWLHWFLGALDRAFDRAELVLGKVIQKARFWDSLAGQSINDRQRLMLNRLLGGFEGKLTSSKWAKLAKTSPDTALRDINDLVSRDILVREAAGGRSTSYALVLPETRV